MKYHHLHLTDHSSDVTMTNPRMAVSPSPPVDLEVCVDSLESALQAAKQGTVPPPSNTADLGTDEKVAVFGSGRYWESYIAYKTLI